MKFRTFLQFLIVGSVGLGGLSLGGCKKPTLPNAAKPVAEAAPEAGVETASPAAEQPPPPKIRQPDTKGSVISLCYHRFEEKPKDSMAVTPAAFEAQLQALKEGAH